MASENPSQSYYGIGREALYPQEQLVELGRKGDKLTFGIPKEDNTKETRIPLTPQGVGLLKDNGHQVFMQSGAGLASRFTDTDYSEAGAFIVSNKKEIFSKDIVVKVSSPNKEEIGLMKERAVLVSLLNYAEMEANVLKMIMQKKVTAIAMDLLMDEHQSFPVVRSLSEIEGNVAVMVAAQQLGFEDGGKGVLLGGVTGISPTELVILGAGTAGTVAAKAALGLGAEVKVFDQSISKLRDLVNNLGQNVFTSNLHPNVLSKALKSADAVVGTLRFLYGSKRFMVTNELVQLMKPGAVIIDLSVDQGGCFETSSPTTLKKPLYKAYKIKHFCLAGISMLVPRTASIAFSNILTQLFLEVGDRGGVMSYIKEDKGFCNGVYCYQGILTNHYIGSRFNLPSKDIGLLLAAF